MAVSAALSGFGTQLLRGGALIGDAYVAVAEVLDLNHSGYVVTELDASNMDSPSGHKESKPGMVDPGELTFEVNWNADTASHATLSTDVATVPQTVRYWKIIWPPSSAPTETWQVQGYVSKLAPKAPHDGKITAALTIKLSGPITKT